MNTFHPLKTLVISLMLAATLAASEAPGSPANSIPAVVNPLPASAAQALRTATKGTLYSLNPGRMNASASVNAFHGYAILGQIELDPKQLPTAVAAFQTAAVNGASMEGSALCFNPRHGLRVTANGHTYDFVLCYECDHLLVYEDDKQISSINAVGSPKVLNDLLGTAKIPISGPSEAEIEAREKQVEDTRARFLAGMPKSLQALWLKTNGNWPDIETARAELKKEFPEATPRVRALLTLYGAGGGPWNAFSAYEVQAVNLLMDYSDAELAAALQADPLSDAQMEGAARWLTGYRYSALPSIPSDIQAKLLAYVLKGNDDKKVALAKRFFSSPPASPPAGTSK